MSAEATRVAIVTGAGRGIGAATALRLAADGLRVVAADRDEATARATASAAQGSCDALALDVSDRAAVHEAFGAIRARLGRIDVVVNCAMWIRYGHISTVDEETVDGMLGVGLKAGLWTTQAAYEAMRAQGGGVIVHMASPAALHGFPTAGVYSAVKGAVASLTRQSAVELAPDGIRVNAVVPGSVRTEGAAAVVDDAGFEYRRQRTPLGRLGTVEDIAASISFLASDDASFMTGHLLVVDGGITVA
jgi:NAD(P)-dependent dehydrogenase (short-subunit alcohol dehydrogenase family)